MIFLGSNVQQQKGNIMKLYQCPYSEKVQCSLHSGCRECNVFEKYLKNPNSGCRVDARVIQAERCWRRVEDELPELQHYKIVSDGKNIHIGSMMENNEWIFLGNVPRFKVTHWMPLPKPPTDG